jgi:alkanesulfonate monooxygenase SsuD/methylene tetrahydromethanopterin reductase-like flavin-dependent oxidoreductase (luciferase family)
MVAAIGLVVGCGGEGSEDEAARDAAVYRSVISDLVDRSAVVLDDSERPPVLFVEGLASGVPLEVQVEVVADFAEQYEIRFIDELEEAIEADTAGRPVRSNSLLIGLGPVVGDGTASLRGELYVRDGEAWAYGYELLPSGGGGWVIVGDPEPIAPEGFVANP